MISQMLKNLNLPELKSREEMLEIMLEEEYGFLPPEPKSISFETVDCDTSFCAGKANLNKIIITCELNNGSFSFPCYSVIPDKESKSPFFVHINFRDNVPDRYMPSEELIDNGFAVLSFCYNDVTKDNDDFCDGLAGILFKNGKRNPTDAGKIAMWAWASHRVLDYAYSLSDVLDLNCSIVCGHSRLGKTALLAAATDERFTFAYSNDSGCSGAAITRNKTGEHVDDICRNFPFWFCENYKKYRNREEAMPYDQHYLVSSIAPRFVCIGSAEEDAWADPISEMLCCVASSASFGDNGFVFPDRLPKVGDAFFDGKIGYHLRRGSHYFSREDWHRLIEFVNKHR